MLCLETKTLVVENIYYEINQLRCINSLNYPLMQDAKVTIKHQCARGYYLLLFIIRFDQKH
jgi:hypothetical protein